VRHCFCFDCGYLSDSRRKIPLTARRRRCRLLLVHGQLGTSDHYFRSVCLSVCFFVQSFSQPSLIRFRSNLNICYMSGSSCVPFATPGGWVTPKTCIFRGFGAQKISGVSLRQYFRGKGSSLGIFFWFFLANVNSRSRSLYAIARPSVCLSVCRLSSVCL